MLFEEHGGWAVAAMLLVLYVRQLRTTAKKEQALLSLAATLAQHIPDDEDDD